MSNPAKDQDKAVAVFRELVALLEESSFDYAVGGGICTDHWTGGASTSQTSTWWFEKSETVEILETLSRAGYRAAEMEHSWLHKAFKDGVTVDLMFELKNGTTFDDRFEEHRTRADLSAPLPT